MLTPAERRGAVIVLALFSLGTAWDVWRATHPRYVVFDGTRAFDAARARADLEAAAPAAPGRSTDDRPARAPAPGEWARVDLNHANAAELDALPGIGPVLAGRILEYRRAHGVFRSAEDLLAVPGIGPRLFARLRDHLKV